jgi:hypothetical protein
MKTKKYLMHKILLLPIFAGLLSSCQKFESFQENDPSYSNEGYFIKTSLKKTDLGLLKLESPQILKNPSDMFVDGKYLYIAEYAKGIQIYSDPESPNPKALYFIKIPAIRKFTVKDGHIICDNGNDLIAFRITGLDKIALYPGKEDSVLAVSSNFGLINRKADFFTFPNYPTERNVYFECPDSVDFVVEWEKKMMDKKLNCYR